MLIIGVSCSFRQCSVLCPSWMMMMMNILKTQQQQQHDSNGDDDHDQTAHLLEIIQVVVVVVVVVVVILIRCVCKAYFLKMSLICCWQYLYVLIEEEEVRTTSI